MMLSRDPLRSHVSLLLWRSSGHEHGARVNSFLQDDVSERNSLRRLCSDLGSVGDYASDIKYNTDK